MLEKYVNEKIEFKTGLKAIEKNSIVLLANRDNGGALFISKECYEILLQAMEEKMTFGELINCIEQEASKKYMADLLEQMAKKRFWKYDERDIKSADYEISIDITNQCNLNCKHCCVMAGEFKEGKDLDEQALMNMIKKVVKLQPASISISGGEPLMRNDFENIILFIRDNFKETLSLMTNATLIGQKKAEFIAKHFDSVDVSIDGSDEESCKILRGEGTFNKCIEGIKLLQENGMERISASMVITKDNQYAQDSFMELCEKMHLYPMLRGLDPSGRAENFIEDPIEKYQKRSLEEIKENFVAKKLWKKTPQIMACQGAKIEFQISYVGDIYPCGALMDNEFFLGNVFNISDLKTYLEEGFYKKLDGYKNFESYMPLHIEKCKDCEFNLLCFSCVSDIRNKKKSGSLYKDCKEQYFVNNLYWENYECYESD